MFVTVADFTGKYELHTGMYVQSKIQDYIDTYESKYLINLFGASLYTEFMSDLNTSKVPKSVNFLKVYNAFQEDVVFNEILISKGIKEMLLGFIYFEYSKDLINQMTPSGNVQQKGENSNNVSTLNQQIYTRYNEAVATYQAIQKFIMLNQDLPFGAIMITNVDNVGTGYVAATYDLTGGSGTGATITITVDTNGGIATYTMPNGGQNYQEGDTLGINYNNNDAEINVVYVSKGDFTAFNGQYKGFAYWL
jgi:hypothetical protein